MLIGIKRGSLRHRDWVFILMMLATNFEFFFVYLYDFDTIWNRQHRYKGFNNIIQVDPLFFKV